MPSAPASAGLAMGSPGMNFATANAPEPQRANSRSIWPRRFSGDDETRKTTCRARAP